LPDSSPARGYVLLAGLVTGGTVLELWSERHWDTAVQLIPWAAVALLAMCVATLARRTRPAWLTRAVRVSAGAVFASGLYGIYEHVLENYRAGPLDYRLTDKWPTMSTTSRWWTAISKTAGPAPVLAPAILALGALCVLLASSRRHRAAPEL
jgi:hypothetical protein